MRVEIEIHIPESGARETHQCWETAVFGVYQTIVGPQAINVRLIEENVCDMPVPMKGGLMIAGGAKGSRQG